MIIHFSRESGFSNIKLTAQADLESGQLVYGAARLKRTLSADEIRDLENEIKAVNFFDLPAHVGSPGRPDSFRYEVTVEEGGKRHSVSVDEPAQENLQPLLKHLTRLASSRPKNSESDHK